MIIKKVEICSFDERYIMVLCWYGCNESLLLLLCLVEHELLGDDTNTFANYIIVILYIIYIYYTYF